MRHAVRAGLIGLVCASGLSAGELGSLAAAPSDALAAGTDRATRLTIGVMIDGRGPYPFVLDSAATRTVVSRELAATLKLPRGPAISLDDALGRATVDTAVIENLGVGSRLIGPITAPTLAAGDLGADGMLGIDALRNQLIVIDFDQHRLLIGRAAEQATEQFDDTIVVQGRKRFGQLVLVDAQSHAAAVFVILDTGAQRTIGNEALRRLLNFEASPSDRQLEETLISVTGKRARLEVDIMPEIKLGEITINNMPIVYAALHTFAKFRLQNEPALLLGMDVLHLFRRVSVDFRRGEVSFVSR